jgi:hypothetical protein
MMVKIFFLKGHGSKLVHKKLMRTLQDNAISLFTVKNWFKRFKFGDLSSGDEQWPEKLLISLVPALQHFLKKFLFASARGMAKHFSVDQAAIKNILDRELSLRKLTRRWLSHILSTEKKLRRMRKSQSLLIIPANLAEKTFRISFEEMNPGSPP